MDRAFIEYDGSSDESLRTVSTANIFAGSDLNACAPLMSSNTNVTAFFYSQMKNNYPSISINENNGCIYFAISNDITTVAQLRAWLADNPIQVVYTLKSPITYQLTPTEVTTLIQGNTFMSDGEINLTYRQDTNTVIDRLVNAIISLGGNV